MRLAPQLKLSLQCVACASFCKSAVRSARRRPWACLGPDSNRHGVAPKGFSYHFSFRCCARSHAFVVWTLPLPSRRALVLCPRIRQGPSSLYTFPGPEHETQQVHPRTTHAGCSRMFLRAAGLGSSQRCSVRRQLRCSASFDRTLRYRHVTFHRSILEPGSATPHQKTPRDLSGQLGAHPVLQTEEAFVA